MRKLYENLHIFYFQKRIVSAETIRGNTVIFRNEYLAHRIQQLQNRLLVSKLVVGSDEHNKSVFVFLNGKLKTNKLTCSTASQNRSVLLFVNSGLRQMTKFINSLWYLQKIKILYLLPFFLFF